MSERTCGSPAPPSPPSERRSPATCSTSGRPAARSSARPAAARPCRARATPRCSACPSPALGLAGFLGLLVAALARGEWARLSQATLALAAFLFSGYLLSSSSVVIDAICQWCLATDVLTTAIAVARAAPAAGRLARRPTHLSLSRQTSGRRPPPPARTSAYAAKAHECVTRCDECVADLG